MKHYLSNLAKTWILILAAFQLNTAFALISPSLEQVVASKHRTEAYAARDAYRHPIETLKFFGIKDSMTVVEISPGGGWYTEILAPYLKDKGKYIAAGYDPESSTEYYRKNAKKFQAKLAAKPELYGKTQVTIMEAPNQLNIAPANSADLVLTFRNTHNWHNGGHAEKVYAAMFQALKPGGVLGVVQHRAGEQYPEDISGSKGYLKEADVIALATQSGFELVAKSEINANPKDSKNYEKGVWTLPPALRDKDKGKEKYLAIGESDRMTLKFVKPVKAEG